MCKILLKNILHFNNSANHNDLDVLYALAKFGEFLVNVIFTFSNISKRHLQIATQSENKVIQWGKSAVSPRDGHKAPLLNWPSGRIFKTCSIDTPLTILLTVLEKFLINNLIDFASSTFLIF